MDRATPSPPFLLTPGPLTTSPRVKRAMQIDYGSRDAAFMEINQRVLQRLLGLVDGHDSHVCVPVQGSGTFAVEAMIGSLLAANGCLLILVNGEYGRRISTICRYLGRNCEELVTAEDQPPDLAVLEQTLQTRKDISHVAAVYCETTTGILNPLPEIAGVVARHGRRLLVDAMSAFGALPIDIHSLPFTALAASSNKCLQGMPGMGFCIIEQQTLAASAGLAHSLSLDLHAQWQTLTDSGQWRFTPPVQCLLALDAALDELAEEGGVDARLRRYRDNCKTLLRGMCALGFRPYLAESLQAPIIVTFHVPAAPAFEFSAFYRLLAERGFLIYPGKLTRHETFRMGCIGAVDSTVIEAAVVAVADALQSMGVSDGSPG